VLLWTSLSAIPAVSSVPALSGVSAVPADGCRQLLLLQAQGTASAATFASAQSAALDTADNNDHCVSGGT